MAAGSSFPACGCGSSPSPSRARPTTSSSRVAQLTEELGFDAFFRSDHYLRIGEGAPGPGSTDAWVTLAALGRETDTHPARHARHTGDVPASRRARDPGRAGRRDERRPRRARAGRGLVRRRARRVRDPVPADRRPLRDARGAARDRHRHVDDAGRRAVSFAGRHHQIVDSPALPEARATARARRSSSAVGAPSARRALAARFADEFNLPFAPARLLPRRLRPRPRRVRDAPDRDPATMRFTVAVVAVRRSRRGGVRRGAPAAIGQHARRPARQRSRRARPDEVVERIHAFARGRRRDRLPAGARPRRPRSPAT